jgi:peroxidase
MFSGPNNGVDSFLCGSFFDYGFAGDANFAQQIHHRLFETTNAQGETRRTDLVALNICRGREHGLPGYNSYRQLCGLKRAIQFQDFADTMSIESVQKLQMIYQ